MCARLLHELAVHTLAISQKQLAPMRRLLTLTLIDLRDWVHPALQSRGSSFVWTAASAEPTRLFIICYGGGDASDEGLAGALRRLPDILGRILLFVCETRNTCT